MLLTARVAFLFAATAVYEPGRDVLDEIATLSAHIPLLEKEALTPAALASMQPDVLRSSLDNLHIPLAAAELLASLAATSSIPERDRAAAFTILSEAVPLPSPSPDATDTTATKTSPLPSPSSPCLALGLGLPMRVACSGMMRGGF